MSTLVPVWTLLVLLSEALVLGVVPAVALRLRALQCCSQCHTAVCLRRPASPLLPGKHSTGASSVYKSCPSAKRARLVLLLQPVLPGSRGPRWTTAHLLPSQSPRRHLVPRSSGYRFSFLFRASASAAPFSQLARGRGSPFLFKGLTKMVSTASWAPLCSESPVTTHSSLLSSVGAIHPRLKSLR